MEESRTIKFGKFLLPFMFNEQHIKIEADVVKRHKIVTKNIFDGIMHGTEFMEDLKPDLNYFLDFHVDSAEIRKEKHNKVTNKLEVYFYIHLLPSEEELKKLEDPAKKEEKENVQTQEKPKEETPKQQETTEQPREELSLF